MSCPAKDKICTKCAKRGELAKVCRSINVNYMQKTGSHQLEHSIVPEDNNDLVAYAEFMSANGWEENPQDNFTVLAISEAIEIRNSINIQEDLNGHKIQLKTNSDDLFTIADSGSPMSFLNEKTVERVRQNDRSTLFKLIRPETSHVLMENHCSNRAVFIAVESRGWIIQSAPFIIVDDQKANIIGQNTLPKTGNKLAQDKQRRKSRQGTKKMGYKELSVT